MMWRLLAPALVVVLLCGMAMHMTVEDNHCTAAGGRLEFSLSSWDGAQCVRSDGVVIRP